jgi:hypothetical protein
MLLLPTLVLVREDVQEIVVESLPPMEPLSRLARVWITISSEIESRIPDD